MSEIKLSNPKAIKITGCFVPFYVDTKQPCLIRLPDNPNYWVPVYSTVDKLEESTAQLNIKNYSIKQITDGMDFAGSIFDAGVRIMLDPYVVTSEKKTRWTEVAICP